MATIVDTAIDIFLNNPDADWERVLAALAAADIAAPHAWRLYHFVPMAFCRAMLQDRGVRFPSTYIAQDYTGHLKETRLLTAEPLFVMALEAWAKVIARGMTTEQILAVARHSSEWQVIDKLLGGGGEFSDIALVEPILSEYPE